MKKFTIFFLCLFIFLLGTTLAQERQVFVKKSITVTSPKEGDGFKISETIQVSWKSVGITGNVKASLHKYQQSDIQTYNPNLPPTGSLTVPAGKIPPGRYFIRIQEINGTVKGDSGVFSVFPKLDKPALEKREPRTIEVTIPVQKRDRHSKRSQSEMGEFRSEGTGIPDDPTHPSMPSKARVGFENHYWKDGSEWIYRGFVYRSRLFFDVSQFVGKKGILLEANLILKNFSTDSDYPGTSSCGHQLHVLTSVWELPIKCIETPGYFYKNIPPNENNMTIDIVQQVRDWINGTEVNHGLLFTGVNEAWIHNNQKCVSYYTAELYIKFREY